MKSNLNALNVDKMTLAEGNVWGSHGDRFYLDKNFKLNALGLEVEFYKTGAIASAKQHGEKSPHFRTSYFGLRWTGPNRRVPKIVKIRECLVGFKKITTMPSGYYGKDGE